MTMSEPKCEWCDAVIEPDCGSLCDDCKAVDLKHNADAADSEWRYWQHVNNKIDEARGK